MHPFVAFCPYREVESSELSRWDASQGQANPYVPYADPLARDPRDVFSPALRFDPAEQAAWTLVANALLNLDEALTKQ